MYTSPDDVIRDNEYVALMESKSKVDQLQDETPVTLVDHMKLNCKNVLFFVVSLGVRFESFDSSGLIAWTIFVNMWFLLSRVNLILNFVNFVTDCIAYDGTLSFIYTMIDFAIILQLSLLIYSMYVINRRLLQDVHIVASYVNYSTICKESFPIGVVYFFAALGSDIYSAYLWYYYNGRLANKFYFVVEVFTLYSTTCFLTITLMFIIIDTKIVLSLINNITMRFSSKTLTITGYNKIRFHIDQLINSSKGINTCRIGVAMLYVLVVIICLFNNAFFATLSVIASLKEIVFITVIFFEVARVNEQADNLTLLLGKCSLHFDPRESFVTGEASLMNRPSTSSLSIHNTATAIDMEFGMGYNDPDTHIRMVIFNDLICDPISFTLGGKRVTKLDTMLHLAAVILAMLVGIIRSVILHDI